MNARIAEEIAGAGKDLDLDVYTSTHTRSQGPTTAVVVEDAAQFAAAVGRAVQQSDDPDEIIDAVRRAKQVDINYRMAFF